MVLQQFDRLCYRENHEHAYHWTCISRHRWRRLDSIGQHNSLRYFQHEVCHILELKERRVTPFSRSRALYIGLLETMWVVAGGVGPILGGTFAELLSWRWAFWINLPVCGTTFVLLLLFLDVHNPRTKAFDGIKAIDWCGSVSILGLTLMLMLGLNFGGEVFPWSSPKVICLIIFGSLMSILFIFSEKKLARYPLMPPAIFGHRSNISSLLVTFFHGIVSCNIHHSSPITDPLRMINN